MYKFMIKPCERDVAMRKCVCAFVLYVYWFVCELYAYVIVCILSFSVVADA